MYACNEEPRRCLDRRAALALVLYVGAALLIAAPVTWHMTETVPRAVRPDTWLNVWALSWTSAHLAAGPAELFDANIFFPRYRTLAYSDHFIGQALLVAPVYWTTANAPLAYNMAWLLGLALTGWGGYLWCRKLLGNDSAAHAGALVAGAVCLLVPGKRTAMSHLQVISLQGVPFALLALHGLLRQPRAVYALAVAGAATYAALCSWYTAAYVGLLIPAVGAIGCLLRGARGRRWRTAGWLAVAVGLTVAVMLPVAAPFRTVQQELAFDRPFEELIATSLRPVDFVASWSFLHRHVLPFGSGAGGHFPGFLAVTLAAIGLVTAARRRQPWPVVYGLLGAGFAILALGPELPRAGGDGWPLPYRLLYLAVPGFTALRNPYRAAFIASMLWALAAGVGARELVARVFRDQAVGAGHVRRIGGGDNRRTSRSMALLGVALAGIHWAEAWPGPQEVAPLPTPPSPAQRWLAERPGNNSYLEWPLPHPPDENARYQLWSIGYWVPLANGHSGLYPPELMELYEQSDDFTDSAFLETLKRHYPVGYLLAHFEGRPDDAAIRRRAATSADLEPAWQMNGDVVYRLGNGSPSGRLRRRIRSDMLGELLRLDLLEEAAGCSIAARLNGAGLVLTPVPGASRELRARVAPADLQRLPELLDLEVWLRRSATEEPIEAASPTERIRVDLRLLVEDHSTADTDAERPATARLEVNGHPLLEGRIVMALVDANDGAVRDTVELATARLAEADPGLRRLLAPARAGDVLAVAVADSDAGVVAGLGRLRLLLDAAGGVVPSPQEPLFQDETGFAFIGVIGSAVGTARELVFDDRRVTVGTGAAPLVQEPAGQARGDGLAAAGVADGSNTRLLLEAPAGGPRCLVSPIVRFEFVEAQRLER